MSTKKTDDNKVTLSILATMSSKFGMEPAAFEATVRATCSPSNNAGTMTLTREEFAAFLLVANQYGLNPLTKEIYAYPKRGGGVVPVVSVDGWLNLINSHPQCDGWETVENHDEKTGKLVSVTTKMHRKDRKFPVTKTEYLSECIRDTEPWKMQHRMLGHKSLIQAGRYAFGFAGIYDEDEARIIAEAPAALPERVEGYVHPLDAHEANRVRAIEHKPSMAINVVDTNAQPEATQVEWTETAETPVQASTAITDNVVPIKPPTPRRPPPLPPRATAQDKAA